MSDSLTRSLKNQETEMKRLWVLLVLLSIFTVSSFSLPRFSSRSNYACRNCHVNPTGGGMRLPFGVTFGREELPIKSWQEEFNLEDFNTTLTNFLSYGLDFRLLYFYQDKDKPATKKSSFFPMQMDVYFNFAISKKINMFVNPAFGPYQRHEVFGLAKVLPTNGYIKVGRFTPSYGLRLDDHTSYVRDATPFRNNSGQQTGFEVAFAPEPFSILGAITNGSSGDRVSDLTKAFYVRAEARAKAGPVSFLLGASTYNDVTGPDKINLLGGFGSLSIGERLTIIADGERIVGNSTKMSVSSDRTDRNGDRKDLEQLAVMIEADYQLVQGFDLKLMYDFFDPDTKLKTGRAARYSAGFEFFPFSGVEMRPLFRYTDDTVQGAKITDIHVLFHFYL